MTEEFGIHTPTRTLLLPVLKAERCIVCHWCIDVCPVECLGLQNGLPDVIRPALCTFCGVCAAICPTGALNMPDPDKSLTTLQADENHPEADVNE